jgi:hypothetical protein
MADIATTPARANSAAGWGHKRLMRLMGLMLLLRDGRLSSGETAGAGEEEGGFTSPPTSAAPRRFASN